MRSGENQGSSSPLISFGRSFFSSNRGQMAVPDSQQEPMCHDSGFSTFHEAISSRFHDVCNVGADEFLSLDWLMKLLDVFSCCHDEFRAILLSNKLQVSKPPLDRLVGEYYDRSIKALDICNATRDGIEKVRQWEKQLEILLRALDCKKKPSGQFLRAKKALMDLSLSMLDDKEAGSTFSQRNRSFGRHNSSRDQHRAFRHARSLSWSVSPSWSAAKQLLSISNSLCPPRTNEIAATNGLALPVFTMSFVLMFVLWTLVAAIPCQDRGLNIHFSFPRHLPWVPPFVVLHERIMEESRKRERKNSNGLLKEIHQIERCAARITDMLDSVQPPWNEEQAGEVRQGAQEVATVCAFLKDGLDPFERRLREIFKKIMLCRTEGLEFLGRANAPD